MMEELNLHVMQFQAIAVSLLVTANILLAVIVQLLRKVAGPLHIVVGLKKCSVWLLWFFLVFNQLVQV